MDPEHREELEQNDLQAFLTNLRTWWSRHGTTVLLVVLVGVAAFLFVSWYSGRKQRMLESAYGALANTSSPAGKQDVAREYAHLPKFASKARLEAADMMLSEALGIASSRRMGGAQSGSDLSPKQRTQKLKDAARLYERVIEMGATELHVLNARFGLAAASESLGNFDQARTQYQKIQKQAEGKWPPLAERATRQLAEMDRVAQPVEFPEPPEPKKKPQASGQGSGQPGAGESGAPLPGSLGNIEIPTHGEGPDGGQPPADGSEPVPAPPKRGPSGSNEDAPAEDGSGNEGE